MKGVLLCEHKTGTIVEVVRKVKTVMWPVSVKQFISENLLAVLTTFIDKAPNRPSSAEPL